MSFQDELRSRNFSLYAQVRSSTSFLDSNPNWQPAVARCTVDNTWSSTRHCEHLPFQSVDLMEHYINVRESNSWAGEDIYWQSVEPAHLSLSSLRSLYFYESVLPLPNSTPSSARLRQIICALGSTLVWVYFRFWALPTMLAVWLQPVSSCSWLPHAMLLRVSRTRISLQAKHWVVKALLKWLFRRKSLLRISQTAWSCQWLLLNLYVLVSVSYCVYCHSTYVVLLIGEYLSIITVEGNAHFYMVPRFALWQFIIWIPHIILSLVRFVVSKIRKLQIPGTAIYGASVAVNKIFGSQTN